MRNELEVIAFMFLSVVAPTWQFIVLAPPRMVIASQTQSSWILVAFCLDFAVWLVLTARFVCTRARRDDDAAASVIGFNRVHYNPAAISGRARRHNRPHRSSPLRQRLLLFVRCSMEAVRLILHYRRQAIFPRMGR